MFQKASIKEATADASDFVLSFKNKVRAKECSTYQYITSLISKVA